MAEGVSNWARQRAAETYNRWGAEGPRQSQPRVVPGGMGQTRLLPSDVRQPTAEERAANATAAQRGAAGGRPQNSRTNQYRQGVFDWIEMMFEQLGDPRLGSAVKNVLRDSRSDADALMQIRQLPEYAARFPGNVARIKAGLTPMEEGAYIAQETAYRQVLEYYGLPKGFYDDPTSDFANWIANDVSPDEIKERASMASRLATNADPNIKAALQQFYGVSDGDLTAYFLDRKRTTDILERQVRTAEIGGEVLRSNLLKTGRKFAESLVDAGVDAGQARGALADVADEVDTVEMLGNIDGQRVTRKDQVEAKLGLDANADQKVRGLKSRERARFSGSGAGTRALGSGDAAGAF